MMATQQLTHITPKREKIAMHYQSLYKQWIVFSIMLLAAFTSTSALAGLFDNNAEPEFLSADQAFRHSSWIEQGKVKARWEIEPGYYLYKKRLKFSLKPENNGALNEPVYLSKSVIVDDPEFGEVEVFKNLLEVEIALSTLPSSASTLEMRYQGCAEAGLCYPPQKSQLDIDPSQLKAAIATTSSADNDTSPPSNGVSSTALQAENETNTLKSNDDFVGFLSNASLLTIVGLFFLLGLGLTFTPCVFPMIPILSGIIVGQEKSLSTQKAFILSLTYVLGMAITYALAGVAVGKVGAAGNVQIYMQNPIILSIFAVLFVVLALSMFGFYELQLPSGLQQRLTNLNQKQQGGTFAGVFTMGALSALVVSPCVSAPLAGTLVYISSTGDSVLGGLALLALGLGMGAPLVAIGTTGGKFMLKAGAWMVAVKSFFGVMLLGVAIWLLERFLPGPLTLALWAMLIGITGIQLGALDAAQAGMQRFWKGVGAMMLIYGVVMLVGASMGSSNPLQPISIAHMQTSNGSTQTASTHAPFQKVFTSADLDKAIAKAAENNQGVILDFYADWCAECKVLERHTFSNADVIEYAKEFAWIQADITDNTDDHQQLLNRYGLFGPPSILFFNAQGVEIKAARLQGEIPPQEFISHLQTRVEPMLFQNAAAL